MADKLDAFHDADRVLRQAAATFFAHLSEMCEGILVVDREARIVWANDRWQRYLAALGFSRPEDVIGRPVEEVVPNTLMRHVVETGKPILLDILENKAGTYVVSRFPLHDDDGELIGAVGLILYDQLDALKPMVGRINRLQTELAEAQKALARTRRTRYTFSNFVGNGPAALALKSRARRAAVLNTTVLLQGETGTGKELLAQAIHGASSRAGGPFIAINVAAVPDTLLEAEFFGVAPGAYTGADRRGRDGKFKLAHGGTLFLDEIGDMPLALQGKLLRVLQEREFEPLGSNQVVRVDVRVIAATSLDLSQLVAEGRFRADLYYRLNVLPIRLPPLRERLEDLEPLCEHLLEEIAAEHNGLPKEIDPQAIAALARLPWPGNIRELRNALEQASSFWDGMRLTTEAFSWLLPPDVIAAATGQSGRPLAPPASVPDEGTAPGSAVPGVASPSPMGDAAAASPLPDATSPLPDATVAALLGQRAGPGSGARPDAASALLRDEQALSAPLPELVRQLENQAIRAALRATGGNRMQAARRLGISRATLYQKLAERPELSE